MTDADDAVVLDVIADRMFRLPSSDSVFDVNEIAAVIADAFNRNAMPQSAPDAADIAAAAVVTWLDERIFAREYRGDGSINAVIVQPEDQHD